MTPSHALSQVLDRPQLKLLHRTFGSLERGGNLPDALAVHEPHLDHLSLQIRKPLDELDRKSVV